MRVCLAIFTLFVALVTSSYAVDREQLIYLRDNVMAAEHPDVRDELIQGYATKYSLSKDELSMQLVELARTLSSSDPYQKIIHVFTVGSLGKFGTTNALEFLENEVLYGNEDSAFDGYGRITGFDKRFVNLAQKIMVQNVGTNNHRRGNVYGTMDYRLNRGENSGVKISDDNLLRMKEFLRSRIQVESQYMAYLDEILCDADATYSSSSERKEALHRALSDTSITQEARNHLTSIIAGIDAAKNAPLVAGTASASIKRSHGSGWIAVSVGAVVLLSGVFVWRSKRRAR